jgi:hypothetical protein
MPRTSHRRGRQLLGASAIGFSLLYLLSDVIEALQGGFSTAQLWMTVVAEAAIPWLVVGLGVAQRPRFDRLGLVVSIAYAYAFVYYTGTVVYALVNGTPTYAALTDDLGGWMTIHGAIMVFAGLGFGAAVMRASVLPRWTGVALMVGVVAVAATQNASEPVQVAAAAIRDLGFAGMGAALLRSVVRTPTETRRPA